MAYLSAKKCQYRNLATPRNGKKECKRNAGDSGWDCKLTCDSNTYFHDDLRTEKTFSCYDNGDWSPTTPVPDCIGEGWLMNVFCVGKFASKTSVSAPRRYTK